MLVNEEMSILFVMTEMIRALEWNKLSPDFLNGVKDIFQHARAKKIILTKQNEWRNGELFWLKEIIEIFYNIMICIVIC